MTQDQPSEDAIKQTLLTDIEVVSANDLLMEIQKLYGVEIGKQFIDLVLKGTTPADKQPLRQFFAGRKDLISQNCASQLE